MQARFYCKEVVIVAWLTQNQSMHWELQNRFLFQSLFSFSVLGDTFEKGRSTWSCGEDWDNMGVSKISLIRCNFLLLSSICYKRQSKQETQCKSRTLEPVWTEGTMTVQVDEALEEVAFLIFNLNPISYKCWQFCHPREETQKYLGKNRMSQNKPNAFFSLFILA